jgi:membrane protein required for colicin V production
MAEINWMEIAVVAVLLIGLIMGTVRGLIKVAISIAVSILTIVLTILLTPYVFKMLSKHKFSQLMVFAVTLVVLFIVLKIVTYIIEAIANFPVVSILNRILGAFAGLIGAIIIVWIVFTLIAALHSFSTGKMLYETIEKSYYLKSLYEMNPITKFAGV